MKKIMYIFASIIFVSCLLTSMLYADDQDAWESPPFFLLSVEYVATQQLPVEGHLLLKEKVNGEVIKERASLELNRTDYNMEIGQFRDDTIRVRTTKQSFYELRASGKQLAKTWVFWALTPGPGRKHSFVVVSDEKNRNFLFYVLGHSLRFTELEALKQDPVIALYNCVKGGWRAQDVVGKGGYLTGAMRLYPIRPRPTLTDMGSSRTTVGKVQDIRVREDDTFAVSVENRAGEIHTFVGEGYTWSLLEQTTLEEEEEK